MSRIQILPDQVANQIAAGEVIERPVAVVKELVENSLDAGATRVEVEFRNGGKSYIRVEDNGCGMTPEDALLCLERHATSKITGADDLFSISSFGFRGEAMPSIASVSKFTLRTRPADAEAGTEVLVNAGKTIHQREVGMPIGTRLEVSQLFNSVPVRRKFLKADNTEAAHIVQLMRQYAVAHPQCAFVLIDNGRTLFQSPVCRGLVDRVGEIWGRKIARDLIKIETEESGIRLRGLLGKPGISRSTRQEMITLVNGRPVDSRVLYYALVESYHTFIPKGRYPLAFLLIDLDPSTVDVNVHPAKREVRFRNEGDLRRFVMESVVQILRDVSQEKDAWVEQAERVEPVPSPIIPSPVIPSPRVESVVAPPTPVAAVECVPAPVVVESPVPVAQPKVFDAPVEKAPAEEEEPRVSSDEAVSAWQWMGAFASHYAVFETQSGILVLYPPRARARIIYERVLNSVKGQESVSQTLLMPLSLDLPPVTAQLLKDQIELLSGAGFGIEEFGRNFYRITRYPNWLEDSEVEPFFNDLLERLQDGGMRLNERKQNLAAEALAKFVSRFRGVRRGERELSEQAMMLLSEALFKCDNPLTDPEGNPTYIEVTHLEFKQRFGF